MNVEEPPGWKLVSDLLGIFLLLFLAVSLFGCPKPMVLGPAPRVLGGFPACPADAGVNPTIYDLCGETGAPLFTADSMFVCVMCETASGCVDAVTQSYCVIGGCMSDGRCVRSR